MLVEFDSQGNKTIIPAGMLPPANKSNSLGRATQAGYVPLHFPLIDQFL